MAASPVARPAALTDKPDIPWHALPPDEVARELGAGPDGLDDAEVRRRLERHGPNTLERTHTEGPLKLLLRQINNPLIWVLLASSALAIVMGKLTDGLVVLAVVALNTLIGFVQEFRAGRAIEALFEMVPEQVTVRRAGAVRSIPSAEVVPGDIVLLASGDKVPADMRLLEVRNLQIEEAALTGESVPVHKGPDPVPEDAPLADRTDMAYGGTLVTYGTATAVVVSTGGRTELGRISALLHQTTDLQTPLTKALAVIGWYLTVGIVVISILLLAVGLLRGYTLTDALLVAIALAVAAIPEGLPAIVTIALAIGVQRMAARRAVIRKLPAVETLGSTTIICSDKTGTLTRNEMTVRAVWTPAGYYEIEGVGYAPEGGFRRGGEPLEAVPEDLEALLVAGALCNDASIRQEEGTWKPTGDPTEVALVVAAAKARLEVEALRSRCPRIDAIPFESERQFMATLHRVPDPRAEGDGADARPGRRLLVKGAPEVVARRCQLPDGLEIDTVLEAVELLAAEGMRVLAVAGRDLPADQDRLEDHDVEGSLTLFGLQGMIDPARPEAIEAVRACQEAGIIVKMITGDHLRTAEAVATQLGLLGEGRAVAGSEIERLADEELLEVTLSNHVFARVAPEHKLRLVRALQRRDHVVAMTGDGVNDAPSLKQANIGVAMGITGTSVSRESADIVLTDDNFASIAAAVEEGRRVYDNLVKSLAFVLPTNLGLALILVAAVVAFPIEEIAGRMIPLLPMRPTQLLWINLVATVALALPLAFEVKEPDVMRRPPRDPAAPVMSGFLIIRTLVVAVLMAAGAIGLFTWEYGMEAERVGGELALREAQTMAVTTVIMFQIFYLLNCRSLHDSIFRIGFFSNRTVFIGIGALLLLQLAFIYLPFMQSIFDTAPLSPGSLAASVLAGAIVLPVIHFEKWYRGPRPG